MKEKNNFTHVLEYLLANGMIHNQKDLAKRLNTTETTVTRNKKGNVKHPDEDTIRRFNAVFGDIINIAYLRGESDIMLVADLPQRKEINTAVNSRKEQSYSTDYSSLINAALAAKDDAIMALKHELIAKDETIATKDALILSLQQQLQELRAISAIQKGALHGCYPLGTAEEQPGKHEKI